MTKQKQEYYKANLYIAIQKPMASHPGKLRSQDTKRFDCVYDKDVGWVTVKCGLFNAQTQVHL